MLVIAPIGELHTLTGKSGPRKGREMRETGFRQNAGIALDKGLVVDIDDSSEVLRKYPNAEVISATGNLVTPGLVDCHTHLVWAGDRSGEFLRRCAGESYQEIAKGGGGILATSRAVNSASESQMAADIVDRANLLLDCGTTSIEIKASYGLSAEGCKKELDAIAAARKDIKQRTAVTFMAAHAIPDGLQRERFIDLVERELIPMASRHPCSPQFNDVFCEEGAFSVEESRRILEAGLQCGLRPKIHSDEFVALGGTEMACALGAISCDHLLASGEAQIAALAGSNTVAVTMPGTAFYLGKPFANARKMVDAGCAVALGTDLNPGSSMVASMAFVMGLAVSRMGLSPEEALCAATANAASAIGLNAGMLAPGSPADVCIWPCGSLQELVYSFTFVRPRQVFVGGERLK
jgi:imidazolonepropionase